MSKQKLRVESKNQPGRTTSREDIEIYLLIERLNRRIDRANLELEMLADGEGGSSWIQECIENYLSFWQILINVYALLMRQIFALEFEKNDRVNFEKVQKRLKEKKTPEAERCIEIWQKYAQQIKRHHHAHLRNVVQHEGTLHEEQFQEFFAAALPITELTLHWAIFNDDESRLTIAALRKSVREFGAAKCREYQQHLLQTVKMFQETVEATDHLWQSAAQPEKSNGRLKRFLEGDDSLDRSRVQ